MWSIAALVLVLTGPASCYVTCPDGKVCSDQSTCCLTNEGYACCPVPHAVCCSDMAHCCPSGFLCNTITQMCEKEDHPWSRVPTLKKVAAEEPSTPVTAPLESDSSRVQSKAVESSMVGKVPGTALAQASDSTPQAGVIRCDTQFYCPSGTSCCKGPTGKWGCCPYPLGKCCADGQHCCEYGYTCDPTSYKCRKWYSQIPSGLRDDAKQD
ncbi:progranulin isoform X2 [Coregonus clupeaformis]|uniref:progranulin isoform X2 n=1 Tax=Coregonus clupeaformis TaxID=59861 RepID=UPI001BE0784B|nr:progranulin isoform X2 [Coregonus clupeaformis]